ncbi:high affinity immunoglobulin epsilon receptor subunit beta-like [Plectropomus leopardus]|uniref:high affinity immunoglobulin epsilon receptor subunit beta-like n=1 Tax=Plectropomus leopardus TaxID=160734 RepID=UPI001C4D4396|nr:high affinity immunoglobulin epsilon receptor subunit beta-like [Plectropomus leopardus]
MTSTSTSTSITKVGGVVIVTQVIPQDEGGIRLQSSPSSAVTVQAPPPPPQAPPTASPTKMDDMTAIFLRGQPHGLGVVQIFIGLLCVLFSLTAVFSPILIFHAPFCIGVTFVVSGSLAVAAGRRTSVNLVWATLVWNVIGVVVGLLAVAYVCWLLADRPASQRFCDPETFTDYVPTDRQVQRCISTLYILDVSFTHREGPLHVYYTFITTLFIAPLKLLQCFDRQSKGRKEQ